MAKKSQLPPPEGFRYQADVLTLDEEASVVEVRFGDGDVLRVPTFAGPEPLQHVRFYAAQLPTAMRLAPGTFAEIAEFLESVAGLDANGAVVACSATRTADEGSSSLSDCR